MYPYYPYTDYVNFMMLSVYLIIFIPTIIGIIILIFIIYQIRKIDDTKVIKDDNRTITTPYTASSARRVSDPQPKPSQPRPPSSAGTVFCPNCGTRVGEEDAFCTSCGSFLRE